MATWYKDHNLSLVLFPLLAIITIILKPAGDAVLVNRMFAVVVLMAGWWVTEAIPIAVTSILPVALFPLLGIMDGGTAASQYFNDIIFLFLGGFILSLALEKWDLHLRIAYRSLRMFGSGAYRILLGFMVASSFLSMWMSNTATAVMMLPIALSVVKEMEHIHGKEKMHRYRIALLLGIAYACSVGGITTLIGTPPNLALVAILKNMYPAAPAISFSSWLIFALPGYIVLLLAASMVLYLLFKPDFKGDGNFRKFIREENKKIGKPTPEQQLVLILFLAFALLLIFKNDIVIGSYRIPGWAGIFSKPSYIKDGTVAVLIASLLFVLPSKTHSSRLMNWSTAVKLPWRIILLFGGGFALAKGSVESGLTHWIGMKMAGFSGMSDFSLIAVNATMMAALTEFTSNTSTAQILLPVVGAFSEGMKMNPEFLMIPVAVASSLAFMLPIATPPNAIVFGSGYIRMRDMLLPGLLMNIIGIIVITLLMYFWGVNVFHIDPGVFPAWAGG